MENENKATTRKPNRRDIQRRIDREAVEVTARQVGYAWAHSLLRGVELNVLPERYRALPLDIWEDILRYVGTDRSEHVSENRERDNYALCFAADVSSKFDANGAGIVLNRKSGQAYNILLVYDARYARDERTADKALRIARLELQDNNFAIDTSGFLVDEESVAFLT